MKPNLSGTTDLQPKSSLPSFFYRSIYFFLLFIFLSYHIQAQTVNITGFPQETQAVSQGFRNRVLYLFKLEVSGGAVNLTGINGLQTIGTYTASDVNATASPARGFRIQYFDSASYANNLNDITYLGANATSLITDVSSTGTGEELTFSPFSAAKSLANGVHYIYVTVDIANIAVLGRTIGLAAVSASAFQFSGSPVINVSAMPASGLQTFATGTLTLSSTGGPIATSIEKGNNNVSLYRLAITSGNTATTLGDGTGTPQLLFSTAGTYSGTSSFNNLRIVYSFDGVLDN